MVDIKDILPQDAEGRLRIIHELVPGKQITLAHIIGGPIGIINMSPAESAVIAGDIATKEGDVYLGFVDRFSGTLIITGLIAEVTNAVEEIVRYFGQDLGYAVCEISRR